MQKYYQIPEAALKHLVDVVANTVVIKGFLYFADELTFINVH